MTYRIKNWTKHYAFGDFKKCTKASWFPMSNKYDGKSYRRLMRMENGWCHYAAWTLILGLASKCPERGVLADEDGALTIEDMAIKTDAPVEIFRNAIKPLVEIGWLECDEQLSESFGKLPKDSESFGKIPPTGQDRTGQDNTNRLATPNIEKPNVRPSTVNGLVFNHLISPRADGGLELPRQIAADLARNVGRSTPDNPDTWTPYTLGMVLWADAQKKPHNEFVAFVRGCCAKRSAIHKDFEQYQRLADHRLRTFRNKVEQQNEAGDAA